MPNYGDTKVSNRREYIYGTLQAKGAKGGIVSVPKWFLVDRGAEGSAIDEENLKKLKGAGGTTGPAGGGGRGAGGEPLGGISGVRQKVPVKKANGTIEDRYCDGGGRMLVVKRPYSILGVDQLANMHCVDGNYSAANQSWDGLLEDPRGPNEGYNYGNFW